MSIASGQETKSIAKIYTLAEDLNKGEVVRFRLDGTIDRVFGGAYTFGESFGSSLQLIDIAVDKFLVVCLNNSNEVVCIVANVLGTTITYGPEFKFSVAGKLSAVRLNDNKVLITYHDVTNTQYEAVVVTITGDNVAFGAPFLFDTTLSVRSILSLATDKVLVALVDATGGNTLAVLEVTSTSVSNLGSSVAYTTGVVSSLDFTLISVDKALLFYHDGSNDIRSVTAEISGTNITYGTEVLFSVEGSGEPPATPGEEWLPGGDLPGSSGGFGLMTLSATKIDNDKVVLAFEPGGLFAQLVVVTVTGTVISFGVAVEAGGKGSVSVVGVDVDKAVMVHSSGANVISITGTAILVGPPGAMGARIFKSEQIIVSKVAADKIIAASGGSARIGVISGITIYFDTREQFIGIMAESGLANESKEVIVTGIYVSDTPLEPGKYFISNQGTIERFTSGTGEEVGAGNRGEAISATSIIGKAIDVFDFLITS